MSDKSDPSIFFFSHGDNTILTPSPPGSTYEQSGCDGVALWTRGDATPAFHCLGCALCYFSTWFESGPFRSETNDPIGRPIAYGAAIVSRIASGMTVWEADSALSASLTPVVLNRAIEAMANVHWQLIEASRDIAVLGQDTGGSVPLPFYVQGVKDHLTAVLCAMYVEIAICSVVRQALRDHGVYAYPFVNRTFDAQPSHLRSLEEMECTRPFPDDAFRVNEACRRGAALGAAHPFGSSLCYTNEALIYASDMAVDYDDSSAPSFLDADETVATAPAPASVVDRDPVSQSVREILTDGCLGVSFLFRTLATRIAARGK